MRPGHESSNRASVSVQQFKLLHEKEESKGAESTATTQEVL